MPDCLTIRAERPPSKSSLPFASLPHALRRDDALRGRDKAILLAAALLEYARGKPSTWVGNRRLADDLGCSVRTVQLALADLKRAGWVRVELGAQTPTTRLIVLVWREADCAPSPPSVALSPVRPVAHEVEEREKRTAGSDSGKGSPIRAAGEEVGDAPATAEDLSRFQGWAAGSDPVLARFGRSAMKLAGVVDPPATADNVGNAHVNDPRLPGAPVVTSSEVMPPSSDHFREVTKSVEFGQSGKTALDVQSAIPRPAPIKGEPRTPMSRRSPALPSRRHQQRGARRLLEGIIGQCQALPALEVFMTRRSP